MAIPLVHEIIQPMRRSPASGPRRHPCAANHAGYDASERSFQMPAPADHQLLFGLLALQNGLISQVQLVAAFQSWTLDRTRSLAEQLEARGDLDGDGRTAVEAMVAMYVKKHGGNTEKCLAAIPAGRSTRESLARLNDPELHATLGHVGAGHPSTQEGE